MTTGLPATLARSNADPSSVVPTMRGRRLADRRALLARPWPVRTTQTNPSVATRGDEQGQEDRFVAASSVRRRVGYWSVAVPVIVGWTSQTYV